MMDRTEKLFAYITKKLNINSVVFNGQKVEFKYPFNKINMVDELNKNLILIYVNLVIKKLLNLLLKCLTYIIMNLK